MCFRELSKDEINRIDRGIENVLTFVEDVIEDPSILERIPNQSAIEFTPIDEKDPERSYVTETRRLAVSLQPIPVSTESSGN